MPAGAMVVMMASGGGAMMSSDAVVCGRTAFAQRAWGEAYDQLTAADREALLEAADLGRVALSLAGMSGAAVLVQAHRSQQPDHRT
jgi:hypothetical protein